MGGWRSNNRPLLRSVGNSAAFPRAITHRTGGRSRENGRMARILVTEELADSGLAAMTEAGHEVDVRLGLSPSDLLEAVPGAAALVIRSAPEVTADVIEAGGGLVVGGRAGTRPAH